MHDRRRTARRTGGATAITVILGAASLGAVTATLALDRPAVRSGSFEAEGAGARLESILGLVEDSHAPSLIGRRRWSALVARHREAIESCLTHEAFRTAVNRLIESAGLSHFEYFTDEDWVYWHLRSAFGGGSAENQVEHVGIIPQRIDGRWHVRGILEGSAAEGANVRVGDELISVDGEPFRPVASFRGKAGKTVNVRMRRRPDLIYNLIVEPVKESLHRAMQRAVGESVRLVVHDDLKLAYLHGWTLLGDGSEYDMLEALQSDADGLLLDYRDGFGGTWDRASVFLLGASEEPGGPRRNPQWKKPVVILTGDGTRSAKEIVVDAVKRGRRGLLVGEPTPGHVVSVGSVRQVGDDGLLLLPGHRFELEGRPTTPDFAVERDIRYCAGADPQMGMAKEVLSDLIRQGRKGGVGGPAQRKTHRVRD